MENLPFTQMIEISLSLVEQPQCPFNKNVYYML